MISISGVGAFVPEPVPVAAALGTGHPATAAVGGQGFTGVAVAGDIPAPEMALRAAQDACERAGQDPTAVDLLLYVDTWHQGPDGWQPQYYLQRHLFGGEPLAVEIRQGPTGFLAGLDLAARYLRADPARSSAVVLATDNFGTPMIERGQATGTVLGDAAGAVVLTTRPGFARLLSVVTTAVPEAEEILRHGEPLFPPGATTGRLLDHGARLAAHRSAGPDHHERLRLELRGTLRSTVDAALDAAGVTRDRITVVAPTHTGAAGTDDQVRVVLELPGARSTWELGAGVGQLGAADQVVSLARLLEDGRLGAGDRVLLCGLGSGVTAAAAVVEVTSAPLWTD